MDPIAIITLLGIVQGIFLGTLLVFSKGPNRRANRFLGILFICYSLSIFHFFMDRADLYALFPHLQRIGLPVLFLFGPLYYFYVKVLTDRTQAVRWRDLTHGIPFLLATLALVPFFLLGREEKLAAIAVIREYAAAPPFLIVATIQVIHLFIYLYFVRRILDRYGVKIKETKSSLERINLRWLWIGTTLHFVVFGFILILILLQAAGIPTVDVYHTSIPIIVTAIIYGLGYMGLRQTEIFSPAEELAAGRKYEKSALTPELAKEHAGRLEDFMVREKPFLDNELTLPVLAERLGIPAYQLSQVINESLGANFFDYVNGYRVEEAKRLLQDPARTAYTILAIAQEAGFNSKSAFNAAFRRVTGKTPSEFRQNLQKPPLQASAA